MKKLMSAILLALIVVCMIPTNVSAGGVAHSINRDYNDLGPGESISYTIQLDNRDTYDVNIEMSYTILSGDITGINIRFEPQTVFIEALEFAETELILTASDYVNPSLLEIEINYITSQAYRDSFTILTDVLEVVEYEVHTYPETTLQIDTNSTGYYMAFVENTGNVPIEVEGVVSNIPSGWNVFILESITDYENTLHDIEVVNILENRTSLSKLISSGSVYSYIIGISNTDSEIVDGNFTFTTRTEEIGFEQSFVLDMELLTLEPELNIFVNDTAQSISPGEVIQYAFTITNDGDAGYFTFEIHVPNEHIAVWDFVIVDELGDTIADEIIPSVPIFIDGEETQTYKAIIIAPDDATVTDPNVDIEWTVGIYPTASIERSSDFGTTSRTDSEFTGAAVVDTNTAIVWTLGAFGAVLVGVVIFATLLAKRKEASLCPDGYDVVGDQCVPTETIPMEEL